MTLRALTKTTPISLGSETLNFDYTTKSGLVPGLTFSNGSSDAAWVYGAGYGGFGATSRINISSIEGFTGIDNIIFSTQPKILKTNEYGIDTADNNTFYLFHIINPTSRTHGDNTDGLTYEAWMWKLNNSTTGIQHPPTGTVTITGNAVKGQILTVSNTLADADGLGAISYVWQANGVNIGTGSSYALTSNEIGKTITATAKYTDLLGTAESVSSAATTAVTNALVNGTHTLKALGTETLNFDNTTKSGLVPGLTFSNGSSDATWISWGSLTSRINITSIDKFTGVNNIVFSNQPKILQTNEYGIEKIDGNTYYLFHLVDPTSRIHGDATDGLTYEAWMWKSNNPPTGTVSISGGMSQGVITLDASNTLADADGLGAISYLWQANGVNLGTGNSYTLNGNEIGHTFTVTAKYTDLLGTAESVSSDTSTIPWPFVMGTKGDDTLTGTSTGETINGLAGNDTIKGLAGNDDIYGGDGNDQLIGQEGADSLTGGKGNDFIDLPKDYYSYGLGDDTIWFDIGDGQDFLRLSYQGGGTIENDTIRFGAGIQPRDVNLRHNTGSDDLIMSIFSSGDQITIDRWFLNENFRVNRITFADGTTISDVAHLNFKSTLKTLADVIAAPTGGNTASTLTGTTGDDTLIGTSASESINGLAGHDALYGNDGNDTLYGGAGYDYLVGGKGDDTLDGGTEVDAVDYYYYDTTGPVTVNLALGTASAAGVGTDTLISIETVYGSYYADTLIGDSNTNYLCGIDGNDKLDGAGGDDVLWGGVGNDTLIGGTGSDWLYGGNGADIFFFTSNQGNDFIADFNKSEDRVAIVVGTNGITTPAQAVAHLSSNALGNAILDLGQGNTVILVGVSAVSLNSSMFTIIQ